MVRPIFMADAPLGASVFNKSPENKEKQMSENTNISTNELEARLQKADNIRARDGVVWKDTFDRSHKIAEARELPDGSAVKLCGRVTT